MKTISNLKKLIIILSIFIAVESYGQIRLPKLISDGMVLQRGDSVKIWGWAAESEKISIHFIDSIYNTTADSNGEWSVMLSGLMAGGPYEMQLNASNSITLNDIMIGDVWICSGQSNMELQMQRVSWVYKDEVNNTNNEFIRQFYVPRKYDFNEAQKDLESGAWKKANGENILDFSAVAYFFGKTIYDKYKIPVGLVNTSLGGSPAEAWMSDEALKEFPEYYREAQKFKDSTLIEQIKSSDDQRIQAWYDSLNRKDRGLNNLQKKWYDPDLNTSDWANMEIPGYWADIALGPVNGVVWFRKKIEIPSSMLGKNAILVLGRIVDADSAFVNGAFVGTTTYQYPPRRYNIPPGVLKKGENTIVIRVVNESGKGGFIPDKQYQIEAGDAVVNLAGNWQYRLGAEMAPLASQTFIRWKPEGLYNAMLAPLLNYRIKGVIWYQGEANANRPLEYRKLFPAMIQDWRKHWKQGIFPFLYVQLPNFMETTNQPGESNWALLREAQLMSLSVPNTGMAVTIDIGEWNDIHPLDKKDVGERLALAAEKIAYGGKDLIASGPIYESMDIEGNKIWVSFSNTGSGLMSKGSDSLRYFAISGPDQHFVWANAKIENNKVVVWNDNIPNPVAVRYAWADNPAGANLYNKEGLPASPFRTDNFNVPKAENRK
jgi:sialate O-acetylesterase